MNTSTLFMFILVITGLLFLTYGFNTIYAQGTSNAVDTSFNIGYIIAGMALMLIPYIKSELYKRNVSPAVKKLLDQTEGVLQDFVTNKQQLLQLAQIGYSGLPQEYVDKIEGKPLVKLQTLEKQVTEAEAKLNAFLEIYGQLRPKL